MKFDVSPLLEEDFICQTWHIHCQPFAPVELISLEPPIPVRRGSPEAGRFARERDLVHAIRDAFSDRLCSAWAWFSELDSPNGVADLAAVKLCPRKATAWLGAVPPRWAYALASLPFQRDFASEWFAQTFFVTPAYASSVLRLYADAGFCQRSPQRKTWTKVEEPALIAEKIVAIEAKLRDWRKALYQASRYLDYATESWVVLEARALAAAREHAEQFSLRGIGLMGLGTRGELDIVTRPLSRSPRLAHRVWHANCEIARRLS